ncbi:serralysin [Gammaproteobacteria bacterium]
MANLTLNGTANIDLLVGGSGNDTIIYDDPASINSQADSIDGNSGTDTLTLAGSGTSNSFDLTQATITGVEVLQLGYDNSALLSAAQLAGIATVNGDYYSVLTINGSIDLSSKTVSSLVSIAAGSSNVDTIIGSADDNTFLFLHGNNINQQTDTIDGGNGTDTLALTGQSQHYDITQANLTSIETLNVGYDSDVALDAGQLTGLQTITGSYYSTLKINGSVDFSGIALNNLISIEAGSVGIDTLVGSSDDNTFTFMDGANINHQTDTIDGGNGTDTLALTGQVQQYDITNANLTSIETLNVGYDSNVTLAAGQLTGIHAINGSYFSTLKIDGSVDFSGVALNNLISIEAGSIGIDTLVGSGDDNTFTFMDGSNINQQTDTIDGGNGTDTLAFIGESEHYDIVHANLTSIEALNVGYDSDVTLAAGQLVGIHAINGSYFSTLKINGSVDLSGMTLNNLISIEAGSNGIDTLVGSGDDNTFTFMDSSNINQQTDTIDGGNGTDTLALTKQSEHYDITQANLISIEALNVGYGSDVTLVTDQLAGLKTINGSYFSTLKIDGSVNFSDMALNSLISIEAGSTGVDSLVGSGDDNTFTFMDGSNINHQADTINGGNGIDTLAFIGQSIHYDITQANLTSIETLNVGYDSNVTLDAGQLAGIQTINGSYYSTLNIDGSVDFSDTTINSLVSIEAGSKGVDTIIGSADDNTFTFMNGANINRQADNINGGNGTDTLALIGQSEHYDITQANLTSIETLNVGYDSDVTLDAGQLSGLQTISGNYYSTLNIDGSADFSAIAVNNLISIAAGSPSSDTIMGSAGDNTFTFMSGANINNQNDNINGGNGTDTLALLGQSKLYNITQANLTSIETLEVGFASTIIISAEQLANIHTVNGSYYSTLNIDGSVDLSATTVNNLVSIAAGSTGTDSIIGSTDDNTFVFSTNSNIDGQADFIDGGAGNDTLYLAGSMTSYDLSNVDLVGIETVQLAYGATAILTPDQIDALTTIDGSYYSVVQINGPVDISHINVTGFVNIAIGSTALDTVVGSDSDDTFLVTDAANINGQADNLDGAGGNNTLYLGEDNQVFDISQAVLTNFDNLQMAYGNKVTVSADQITNFDALDGHAYHAIHVAGAQDHSHVRLTGTFGIEGLTAPQSSNHGNNHVAAGPTNTASALDAATIRPSLSFNTGSDTLNGSNGDDLYIVNGISNSIVEAKAGGVDTVQSSVSFTLPSNIENLELIGTANINGSGNAQANLLLGNDGANTLRGLAGNDILFGGAGKDRLEGGLGNDQYWVNSSGDVLLENAGEGIDSVFSSITWTLGDNLENLTLTGHSNTRAIGNARNNTLTGNDDNNVLDGRSGADTMRGGTGQDTYFVDNASDITIETSTLASEVDTVYSTVTRTLGANLENLILTGTKNINGTGNALNNTITGNNGNNILDGGAGNDTLIGSAGNDILIGGMGSDKLTGGLGNDIFRFNTALAGSRDTITDYNVANDTIQLENSIFRSLTTTGQLVTGSFHSGAGVTTAADANDFVIYNSTTGALYYDADGNGAGAAIQFATLSTGLSLTSADFLII